MDSPEAYFKQNGDYIRHYYALEAEERRNRLECLKLAQAAMPQGITNEKLIEYSNKLYNWLKNGN